MKRGLQLPFKTSQKKNSTSPPKRKRQRERVFSGWNISRPKPFQTRLNFFSSQQIFLQSIKTFTSFFKHYFVFVLLLILILIQIQNDQRKKERKKERKEEKKLGMKCRIIFYLQQKNTTSGYFQKPVEPTL